MKKFLKFNVSLFALLNCVIVLLEWTCFTQQDARKQKISISLFYTLELQNTLAFV